jgi:hypothetical protein
MISDDLPTSLLSLNSVVRTVTITRQAGAANTPRPQPTDGGYSVSKAKKAIVDYRKAIGMPEGIAELSVFYCEQAARLAAECGLEDEGYFMALVRMFDKALAAVMALEPSQQKPMLERLNAARSMTNAFGWGGERRHRRNLG